jgi:hypothetical protein
MKRGIWIGLYHYYARGDPKNGIKRVYKPSTDSQSFAPKAAAPVIISGQGVE